jgi:alpha-L-fucosidase
VYPERWNAFTDFTHNQVMELMSDYGRVDILWLDGGWVRKRPKEETERTYAEHIRESKTGFLKARIVDQDIRMDDLVAKARQKQPGLIVVDRAVYGKNQNYLTPENRVPEKALPYPWESCIISGGGWSFTPDAKYMSGRDGVHMLVDIVAKGGNLLLNIAPGPDGTWQQGAYDLLAQIGAWMKVNGEAIYGSRAIEPYAEGRVRMTRQKNGTTYFVYLPEKGETAMPAEIRVTSHQPAPGAIVTLLGSAATLAWRPDGAGFVVTIPQSVRSAPPCQHAWTIKVTAIKP